MMSSKLKKQYALLVLVSLILIPGRLLAAEANAPIDKADAPYLIDHEYSFGEVVRQSVYGDVYSDPDRWQELSIGDFLLKVGTNPGSALQQVGVGHHDKAG